MVIEATITWLVQGFIEHWVLHLVWAACLGAGAVLGILMLGHRYKKRIAGLDEKIEHINQHGIRIEGDLQITSHHYGKDGLSRHIGLEGNGVIVIPGGFTGGVIAGLPITGVKTEHTKAKDKK